MNDQKRRQNVLESDVTGQLAPVHSTVLLQEALDYLDPNKGETVVDMTVGNGGHTHAICEKVGKEGRVLGIDLDHDALVEAQEALSDCPGKVDLIHGNFRHLEDYLKNFEIEDVDGVLFDLGLRTEQIFESGRGFSFSKDEPLVMTFTNDPEPAVTAKDVVNTWEEKTIETLIREFADERYAKRIASTIVERRREKPFETSKELAEVIKYAVPKNYRYGRIHPATKSFQAIRMAVNDEVGSLIEALEVSFDRLVSDGRIVVISFHSIEDRLVKRFFKKKAQEGMGEILTKKPIQPRDDERRMNPRSRSAKLRAIKKT